VDGLQRLTIRTFGETEDGPVVVIEPIGDVTDPVSLLNGQIELVGRCDVGGCCARGIVPIQEERHTSRLATPTSRCSTRHPR